MKDIALVISLLTEDALILCFGLMALGSLVWAGKAHAETSLTILVTNIPPGWGTSDGDTVAIIGTMNGWGGTDTAVIQNNSLTYHFTSVGTSVLGSDWSDTPAGANLGFRFVTPDHATTLIRADFRSNDGNFRLAIQPDAGNTVEINAGPVRTLVDQASFVAVNGVRERPYVAIDRNRFAFPGGLWKALVMSYDDGHDQDRGLIPIFNQYGIKGTFHLNSGWLDTSTFVSSEDVRTLYAPHEVSVHTVDHPDLPYVNDETIRWEVGHCRWVLSGLANYDTCSMSYPMGGYDKRVLAQLPGQGITCSRTVENTFSLDYLPVNPLKWHPTCHHANAAAWAETFINRTQEQMALLFIWGHSYELDYGYSDNSWAYMASLCQTLGHRGDTWYAGMEEIRAYLAAIQALTYPADRVVHNPSSSITIWGKWSDRLARIAPGKTVTYPAGEVVATPSISYEGTTLAIAYAPGTNALGRAEHVYLHIGHDGWQDTQDILLAAQGDGVYGCDYAIPAGARTLEWAFSDGGEIWDDANGFDWSLSVRGNEPETPAAVNMVAGTPDLLAPVSPAQNAIGESVDFNTDGQKLCTKDQGGFGSFGEIWVNYDDTYLYLGGVGLAPGGNNNAVMLFLHVDTLDNPSANLWDFTGTPYGLDNLHNVIFEPGINLAILLGDEFGDGNFMHFNLESGSDFGQGVFYTDSVAKRFFPVPGIKLSQFDHADNEPTISSDDDGNRSTDRWKVAIPWSSLNAPLGVRSVGAIHISGLIGSDGTSGSDRYLSANYLGSQISGTLDEFGNYGFNLVTLTGERIGLADADSDRDSMPDVWEVKNNLEAGSAGDAEGDSDGDGRNNLAEYLADTEPTNSASCLQLSATRNGELSWTGGVNAFQWLEKTDDLVSNDWKTVLTNIPPTPRSGSVVLPLSEADGFYRLRVGR